ncbi:MAG TPA: LytTR family DNA-binding domain-containing protein [Gammaproteobacteria bacterium]|nr:LytTR family DNA-binding domain-containing protein [Gammaproteobacteria bacterium]
MRLLIADDEAHARDRLRRMLEAMDECDVVGEVADGKEALLACAETYPDAVLLDIRMPVMDGLEAARHLIATEEAPPAIIFTTAYQEFAVEAFDVRAVAYLLKPVRQERLEAALKNLPRLNQVQIKALQEASGSSARRHLCARLGNELKVIPMEEVLYFHAEQKYVTVRHQHGEVLIDDSLKQLEAEFGDRLLRIHRNALAVLAQVAGLEKDPAGRIRVRFRNSDATLEVSRRQAGEVRQRLKSL